MLKLWEKIKKRENILTEKRSVKNSKFKRYMLLYSRQEENKNSNDEIMFEIYQVHVHDFLTTWLLTMVSILEREYHRNSKISSIL